MGRAPFIWLGAAFLAGLFAVGIPYWALPYSKVSLPSTLMHAGLLVVVVGASVARGVGKTGFVPTLLVVGAAVPCAIMARVILDTLRDPTSHNLWPFELIIAAGVGLLASVAGACLGSVPAILSRFSSRDG